MTLRPRDLTVPRGGRMVQRACGMGRYQSIRPPHDAIHLGYESSSKDEPSVKIIRRKPADVNPKFDISLESNSDSDTPEVEHSVDDASAPIMFDRLNA